MNVPLITLAPTYRITNYTTAPGRDPDGHIFRPSKAVTIDVLRYTDGRVNVTVRVGSDDLWSGAPGEWKGLQLAGFTQSQARAIVTRAIDALTDRSKIVA